MDGDKSISAAVEAAFEAENQVETVETETPVETPENKDTQPESAPATETQPEQPADKPADKDQPEKPEENKPAEEPVAAPQQLKGDFAKNKWGTLDKETQDELSRLCVENERNYKRAAEAEYQNRDLRKKIEPVQGYISEVAESAHITDADVIRNCVEVIQNLNDKPDLTARQMIAGNMIAFADPVAVINEIAHKYGIDLKGEMRPRDIPVSTQVDAARAKYEARQNKYVQPSNDEAEHAAAITEYVNSVPHIKALYEGETRDKFLRQVTMERNADPYASDITIINRAAEMFPVVTPAPVEVADPAPTLAEQKLSKVVAPKASNPVETAPVEKKPEEWTPENVSKKSAEAARNSVRAAMRSLGFDE